MKKFSIPKGFTLIELLVGIAVVGILSTALLSVINPSEQIKKGRDVQRKNDLAQIQRALELYYNDNNRYPEATDAYEITGAVWGSPWSTYIETVPKDPLSPKRTYAYQTESGGYRLFAKFERCSDNQIIEEIKITCDSQPYNYSVTSPNLSVRAFGSVESTAGPAGGGGGSPTPTLTPAPILRVFATSATYTGNLGGLAGADQKCQARADAASLGGAWKAWLSDSTTAASSRVLQTTGNYVLLDGTVVANGWEDLTDGTLDFRINRDENNQSLGNQKVITNTTRLGEIASISSTCQNYTSAGQTLDILTGNTAYETYLWTENTLEQDKCWYPMRLYCFENGVTFSTPILIITVYNDTNNNCAPDTGEGNYTGGNASLTIANSSGTTVVDPTTVSSTGTYTSPPLADGTYRTTLTLPSGYQLSTCGVNPVDKTLPPSQSLTFWIGPIPTSTSPPGAFYVDNDGDGYGAGTVVTSCPADKTCVSNNQDCYDSNVNAKPGQTTYFINNRGDGNWDYDCDGVSTRYTIAAFCNAGTSYARIYCNANPTNSTIDCSCDRWPSGTNSCGDTDPALGSSYIQPCR